MLCCCFPKRRACDLSSTNDLESVGVAEVDDPVRHLVPPAANGAQRLVIGPAQSEVGLVISERDEWQLVSDGEPCWTDPNEQWTAGVGFFDPLRTVHHQAFGTATQGPERVVAVDIKKAQTIGPNPVDTFCAVQQTLARHASTVGFGVEFDVDDERAPLVPKKEHRAVRSWVL